MPRTPAIPRTMPSAKSASSRLATTTSNGSSRVFTESEAMMRLIIALALWLPAVCFAELAGHFEYDFNKRPLLWDFTGTYVIPQGIIQIQNTLTNWPDGKLTGIGHTHYDSFFVVFDADDTQTGRVSGTAKQVRLNAKGLGRFAGHIINPYAGVFKETTKGVL